MGNASREPLSPEQIRLVRSAGLASVLVALLLAALKLIAWRQTGSVALLGSLADSVLDLLASTTTLIAVKFALEPADREHRFGHGKLEAVAGIVQSLIILSSAGYVAYQAVLRLYQPAALESPAVGVSVMLVSVMLTAALVAYQRFVIARTESLAIGADATHYKADLLTNAAVLAAFALSAGFGWQRADPVLGLIVVVVILVAVRGIVSKSIDVLLDRELSAASRARILEIARAHSEVLGVHDLRTRTSGIREFIQFHLELNPELSLERVHQITVDVETEVEAAFPRAEVLIHADPYGIDERQDEF